MYIFQNAHWFLLLIGALVFFHELGHFLVAKAFNVKVLKFSIGFGPKLLGFRRGDTDYVLSLLPFGGFVKMLGEVPGEDISTLDAPRAFSNKPIFQRTLIALAGPVFNFILAIVVYFSMFVGSTTVGDTKLGVVSPNEPAWTAGLRPGDRITMLNNQPMTTWEDLRERISSNLDTPLQVTYERDNNTVTATIQPVKQDELNVFQEKEEKGKIGVSLHYLKPVVAVIDPDSPAAKAGIQTGDVITKAQGQDISAWHELRQALMQTQPDKPVSLVYKRHDQVLNTTLMPTAAPGFPGLDSELLSSADSGGFYTGLVSKDTVVAKVTTGTPAFHAGVSEGDRVLKLAVHLGDDTIAERLVHVWAFDFAVVQEQAKPDKSLLLTIQREQTILTLKVPFEFKEVQDEMKNKNRTLVFGAENDPEIVSTYTKTVWVGPLASLGHATTQVGKDMTLIALAIGKMFTGNVPLNSMGGPIMLFVLAEKSAKRGLDYFLRILAVISVNLGVLNLLPIPVLDGGHILFFSIEALRRKPLSLRVREVANFVGMALLILLMVYVMRNDFLRYVLG